MLTKLQSFLYFAYKGTSSATYFIFSRVTPLGAMMLLVLPVVVVMFLTYFKVAMLFLLILLIGLFACSLVMLWGRSATIEVKERRLPNYATVGAELTYIGKKNEI